MLFFCQKTLRSGNKSERRRNHIVGAAKRQENDRPTTGGRGVETRRKRPREASRPTTTDGRPTTALETKNKHVCAGPGPGASSATGVQRTSLYGKGHCPYWRCSHLGPGVAERSRRRSSQHAHQHKPHAYKHTHNTICRRWWKSKSSMPGGIGNAMSGGPASWRHMHSIPCRSMGVACVLPMGGGARTDLPSTNA